MTALQAGTLVLVRNTKSGVYFVQRFVTRHNGLYFCERDDGIKNQLIGWEYYIPNQGHDLIEHPSVKK